MRTYTLGPLTQADLDYLGALLGQRPLAEARDLANRIELQVVQQDLAHDAAERAAIFTAESARRAAEA